MTIPAKYRKAIYIGAIVVAVAAFASGIVTPDEVSAGVDVASQVVALLASVLALLNITPDPR
jgi:Na+/H+ antiporter NhaD/arsenite permease-like protein